MEITARLKTAGATEVNAVLLNDEGEVYPVFLKSLLNTLIFPELMNSGYTLSSLPYGFTKDGMRFDQIPIQEYTCTDEETELMYNSIGTPMPDEELKKHITVDTTGIAEPPAKYTIFTREEFLRYLDATEIATSDDDFLPLNYFVAPAARFDINEYKNPKNDKYVKLISNRRVMSLKKFCNLIEFLKKIGMPANYNAQDVLDAYFAWGIDGLKFTTINRRRESDSLRYSFNVSQRVPIMEVAYGFVDSTRTQYTPINRRNVAWTPAMSAEDLESFAQSIPIGKCSMVRYKANSRVDITTLEGNLFTVKYNEEALYMQQRTYPSIRVIAPVKAIRYLPLHLALPNNQAALQEYLLTNAISALVRDLRKPDVIVSTYDALMVSGCNPETALKYVTTSLGLNKDRSFLDNSEPAASDSGIKAFNTNVDDTEIANYLSGNWSALKEDAIELINGILGGEIVLDHISNAREMAWMNTSDTVAIANEISAIHESFGVPLEDIYNKIVQAAGNANFVQFEYNGVTYDLSIEKNVSEIKAYRDDIQMYDNNNARDCTFFTFVTYVAREVGTIDTDRHVGIEFYFVNRKKKPVQEVLSKLEEMFVDKITSEVQDARMQQALLAFKNHFILNRYFEIAFKGTITWPKQVGGDTERVDSELCNKARAGLNRRIEMLNAFCNYTADCVSVNNLKFNAFCVNAKITAERIIPRDGVTIKELPFATLWYDWKNANPAVWGQLVDLGVLPADFEAWEGRYMFEHFVERDYNHLFSDLDSLCNYAEFSNKELQNYDPMKEFKSVAHPVTYLYPGLFQEEDEDYDPYADCAPLAAPRQGAPVVRLGQMKEITQKDYAKYLHPFRATEKPSTYIRKFTGFDAATLIMVPNALSMLPDLTDKLLTVMSRAGTIYDGTTQQLVSFRDINKLVNNGYPVSQLTGNIYILRSADGTLWEVRI